MTKNNIVDKIFSINQKIDALIKELDPLIEQAIEELQDEDCILDIIESLEDASYEALNFLRRYE